MLYSLCVLTASCMTAADPPATNYCNCANQSMPQAGVVYQNNANGNLRNRVRNFLGLYPQSSPYHVAYTQPGSLPALASSAPCPSATLEPPSLTLSKRAEDKIGHDDEYNWVTGQLFYVRADGGRWVLRYGRLDEADKYGGSVILTPTVEMRNYREGDVVCVYGQVINEGRPSRMLGGPLYRVGSINMVDRSDP